MHKLIVVFSIFVFLASGQAFAQDTLGQTVSSDEEVSLQDLQAGDPQILPASPFYFFKELTRGVQRVFTFDSVKKAELELRITNEKAAEVKKTQDTQSQNEGAVKRAVENYQKAQESLKVRFEALKETSQNPNIDKLLDALAERVVQHEKLFDEIAVKTDKEEVRTGIKKARERAEETMGSAIAKDDTAKFISRLEKVFVEGKGGELKHIRSLEIIDRISEKVSENAKQSLERLREDFSSRLQENIKDVLEKGTSESFTHTLEALPGDKARRSVLLEEFKDKTRGKTMEALKEASEVLEKSAEQSWDFVQKTQEQIKNAEKLLLKLDSAIGENEVSNAVRRLRENAQYHLQAAKVAFDAQKFREAFGQVRSAEVLARNGLQKIEESRTPSANDVKQHIEELAAKLSRYEEILNAKTLRPALQEKAQSLLSLAKEHLGFARDAFAKEDFITVKTHIEHVKGYLRDLARLVEHAKEEPGEGARSSPETGEKAEQE